MAIFQQQANDTTIAVPCECGDKSHTIYLTALEFDDPAHIEIVMVPSNLPLWERIKQAFRLIFGHEVVISDAVWDNKTAREVAKWMYRHSRKRGVENVDDSDN
jgi:hypothetical protein